MLSDDIRRKRQTKDILLMTHIVIGYPDLKASMQTVEAMVAAGVDMMELQIPFSEPIADGPVILHANQRALESGITVSRCLEFAAECAGRFDIPFLVMTYYNILYRRGVGDFVNKLADAGLRGAIVPDLPPEEASEYLSAMTSRQMSPIFIYSPNTSTERLDYLADFAGGFIYCVARKGVTGAETDFTGELDGYLKRCRAATDLPLAVGFGLKDRDDVQFLIGKADIAVVGSQTIRLLENEGVQAIDGFIRSLAP